MSPSFRGVETALGPRGLCPGGCRVPGECYLGRVGVVLQALRDAVLWTAPQDDGGRRRTLRKRWCGLEAVEAFGVVVEDVLFGGFVDVGAGVQEVDDVELGGRVGVAVVGADEE